MISVLGCKATATPDVPPIRYRSAGLTTGRSATTLFHQTTKGCDSTGAPLVMVSHVEVLARWRAARRPKTQRSVTSSPPSVIMTANIDSTWAQRYFENLHRSISTPDITEKLFEVRRIWVSAIEDGRKIIFAGNGGSAAIASHCSVDLTRAAGMRAVNFNEADLITCFANDYGYAEWLAKAVESYGDPGDALVLISSSGRSPNILRAADIGKALRLTVITLSGFDADNPLRSAGQTNLWVDSHSYNVVEMTHHVWLLAVIDMQIALTRQAEPSGPE